MITDVLQNPNDIAVSTSVRILVNGTFVGVVQSMDPTQTRSTTPVRGIGIGDRIIERVWQVSDYSFTFQKMALFKKFLFETLGYNANFRMIAELRFPLDFQETIMLPNGATTKTTFYRGCYLNNYTAPRSITGDIIIMENGTFDCTSIDDGENSPFDFEVGI